MVRSYRLGAKQKIQKVLMGVKKMQKANQDIRDYMADHGVTQRDLAAEVGVSQYSISKKLQTEMPEKEKVMYLNMIDSIAAERCEAVSDETPVEESTQVEDSTQNAVEDVSCSTKFQIGDRVKIPSKTDKIGVVNDIWSSLAKASVMYAVADESDGHLGLYMENQLEPAPLPIEYSFTATCENNVAVVCMIATQGVKTWVYARGHAHILHDGAVGMAQAISYAGKRMFETLDKAQPNQIYFKQRGNSDDQ